MKRTLIVIAAVIATTGMALVAEAHPGMRRPERHGRIEGRGIGVLNRLPRLKAELGLTDRQQEQIRATLAELREKNAPYREELRGGLRDMTETLLADPQNLVEAQETMRRRANAQQAMQANALTATAHALSILTPEQRMKLATRLSERAERAARRRARFN